MWTPPIQIGIHLVENDGFTLAVSLRNVTDDDITLTSNNGRLLCPIISERYLNGKDREKLWRPETGTIMAKTRWTFEANSTITKYYEIPTPEQALKEAQGHAKEMRTEVTPEKIIPNSIDPDEVGIIIVNVHGPNGLSVSEQYDLRGQRQRTLDSELPKKSEEALHRNKLQKTIDP